jgi:hypothetical protein
MNPDTHFENTFLGPNRVWEQSDSLKIGVPMTRNEQPNQTPMTPQPISTAPSGQRILLYCQRPIESEGWWQIGMHCPDVHRWVDDDYEPDWMLVQPSFWLPLPQPPQPQ